ncbi:Inner membrane protein YejM [Rubripirellula obstinata]|uniref:Inner membrane protein YejM n=1 Tax=Rubripirellula obstinata TaxID=406547 RepID=A0A5B1C9R5_9BACT|nr:sulfatase-like hydrolase/transferase [Rubripirellula obstinata]KAA1257887.1 Inner membrane protein YejM [Rubripirellula obstinata]
MSRTDVWKFVAPLLLWLMLDRLAIGVIDEHLLSSRVFSAITLLPGIVAETPIGFWKTLAAEFVIWVLVCSVLAWAAGRWSRRPLNRGRLYLLFGTAWLAVLSPCVLDRRDSVTKTESVAVDPTSNLDERDRRIRRIGFLQPQVVPQESPDVLIVVLESFRYELVEPEVMPNLAGAAEQGLWCKGHFSSGNATSHGMFSIVTGMDATWFDTSLRYQAPLYRLFRSAGYELGFFAGHDDWRTFFMDGFVSAEQFDEFSISPQNRLESDRQSIQAAMKFLEPDQSRGPRLAILYLYVTHAPYRSYAEDRFFEPAAKDGFLIPYSSDQVDQVWNRYKNSARTADRWIGLLLSSAEDCVVLVTGDHGESFLEDGTIGHGSKISPQQNMTPMILVGPGVPTRKINAPTIHSDVLPTLLAATGIRLSDSVQADDADDRLFDGINLLDVSEGELSVRENVTRDYLTDEVQSVSVR